MSKVCFDWAVWWAGAASGLAMAATVWGLHIAARMIRDHLAERRTER